MNTDTQNIKLLIALAHRDHFNCEEDTWYGCPLSRDGCSNAAISANKCNCGADDHNAEVDRVAAILLQNAESIRAEIKP